MQQGAARKVELWRAAMADDPDLYEVAARLSTIPDAAAATVRFANSAYVGAVYPVGTVLEAVIRVGCRSVGALAVSSLNRDLVDTWGAPELWTDALTVGRAAKVIGRLMGLDRNQNEHLFVAGLFSTTGSLGLLMKDEGYLEWRSGQWRRGSVDTAVLRREQMVYGTTHVAVASELLEEWNLPTDIIAAVAAHHEPVSDPERALRAAMTTSPIESPVRCIDERFETAMGLIGLDQHIDFVSGEARLFAESAMDAFGDEPAVATRTPRLRLRR